MKDFKKEKLKYKQKDSNDVFKEINKRVRAYFETQKSGKRAKPIIWVKLVVFSLVALLCYIGIFNTSSFLGLICCYTIMGFALLLLAINIGHDAAHFGVAKNRKLNDLLFHLSFGINGMSGHLWQIRHNASHHIFPNVADYDSDMEITDLLVLGDDRTPKRWQRYQHILAPFLYSAGSIFYIFYSDIELHFKSRQANLRFKKKPLKGLLLTLYIKLSYIGNFIVGPILFSNFTWEKIVIAFLIMHILNSVFLAFTFFISHHVKEVPYVGVENDEEKAFINDSWIRHQITTTIDFSPKSKVANFIFGGFNLHVAHHIYPEISHTHYPEITSIVEEVCLEKGVSWYKSFSFSKGVISHLKHLKECSERASSTPVEVSLDIK